MTQLRNRVPATPKLAAACCRPIDGLLDAALFKALADPTRNTLLACIAKCGRGCTVSEVAECCSVDVSVVSRHLAILGRAGLLAQTKTGRTVSYRVRYGEAATSLRALADAIEGCIPRDPASSGGCCGPR